MAIITEYYPVLTEHPIEISKDCIWNAKTGWIDGYTVRHSLVVIDSSEIYYYPDAHITQTVIWIHIHLMGKFMSATEMVVCIMIHTSGAEDIYPKKISYTCVTNTKIGLNLLPAISS